MKDGHKYINKAIQKGAKTIIHQKKFEGFKGKVLYLSYKNSRKILAKTSYKFFKKNPII